MDNTYHILVIDDDHQVLKTLSIILTECGYTVACANSGEQAIKDLTSNRPDYPIPDLILLDIMMPNMDGYETCRQIKEFSNIPIIFLSGLDDSTSELQGLSLGAIDYISKPFVKDILLARIKNHLAALKNPAEDAGSTSALAVKLDPQKTAHMKKILLDAEYQVGKLIALGYSNQEIAETLNYSYTYVKKLANSLYEKLDVSKRQEVRPFFVDNVL